MRDVQAIESPSQCGVQNRFGSWKELFCLSADVGGSRHTKDMARRLYKEKSYSLCPVHDSRASPGDFERLPERQK